MLFLCVYRECIGIRVALVYIMVFFADTLPHDRVDSRKESVGIFPRMVDVCDIEFVYNWQELLIYFSPTDDKYILLLLPCFHKQRQCHV